MTAKKEKSTVHIRVKADTKAELDRWCAETMTGRREAADLLIQAGIEAMRRREQTEQQ